MIKILIIRDKKNYKNKNSNKKKKKNNNNKYNYLIYQIQESKWFEIEQNFYQKKIKNLYTYYK